MKKRILKTTAISLTAAMMMSISAAAAPTTANYDEPVSITASEMLSASPSAVKGISAKSAADSITLSWKKVSGASGYRVYRYSNGKYTKVKTLKTTSFTDSGLASAKEYKYKVKAYKKTKSGATTWGKASAVFKYCTTPQTISFKKCTSDENSVTLNWKDVSCTGYQIYMQKNGKWEKLITLKGSTRANSYKITGLSEFTDYSFKVRAFYKNDVNYFGKFKTVNVKTTEAEFLDTLTATEKAYYNLAIGYPSAEDIQLVKDDCIAYTFEKFGGLARGETVTWTDEYGEISITPPAPVEMIVNTDLYANDAIDTNAGFLGGTSNVTRIDKDNIQKLTNKEKKEEISKLIDRCHVGTADMYFGEFLDKFNSGKKKIFEFNIGIFPLGYEEFNVPKYQITLLY